MVTGFKHQALHIAVAHCASFSHHGTPTESLKIKGHHVQQPIIAMPSRSIPKIYYTTHSHMIDLVIKLCLKSLRIAAYS